MMATAKVLLVDDHAIVRTGVRALLEAEEGFEVVGEADSGHEALEAASRLKPDLILLDITLPDMNGLEVMARLRELFPQIQVVILTIHEDEDYFFQAIRAGATGYVVKGGSSDQILAALHAAQSGGVYLHPLLAKTLVAEHLRERGTPLAKNLSTREMEVLRLIADGLVNKEIASRLDISVSTAQTYRTRIMEKLELHTVAELIRYAVRKGIIRA